MKAFFLLLAAFLSTTVTLTNAAALPPRDTVSRLPLSIHNLRGSSIGDGGLQSVALEARAEEEGDVPQSGPSKTGGKHKRHDSDSPNPPKPKPAPNPIPRLIEKVHKMLLGAANKKGREGTLSQGQINGIGISRSCRGHGEAGESTIDVVIREVMDGLVKKGGIPDYLLQGLHSKLCAVREQLIREEEEMEPAEKHRKTDR